MSARDIAVASARAALSRMKQVDPAQHEMILTWILDDVMTIAERAEREECATIADEEANCPGGDSASIAAERIRARGSK